MLQEGLDYYLDEKTGRTVLTGSFLLRRGYCCQSGCRHCPYGYTQKVDPLIPAEWQSPWDSEKKSESESESEVYEGDIPDAE